MDKDRVLVRKNSAVLVSGVTTVISSAVEPVCFLQASALIKKKTFNYLNKFLTFSSEKVTRKNSFDFRDLFFNLPLINDGTKQVNRYRYRWRSEFFLYHLSWTGSFEVPTASGQNNPAPQH